MAVRGDNSLMFASALDNSGLKAGAGQAVGIIEAMANSIGKVNPFLAIGAMAAATFGAVANQAYQMMKAFESAMAEVKTIANVSEAEFKKLEQQVFNLSKTLGTETPDALAKGLYDIIGAGYEAADAMVLLEISSKAATAGVTTSAVAADGLTTILNSFGLAASDAAKVADVMFATVDRGKISFEELSTQIAQVAPLAASSGYSFEEIGGAISTLTKQGVPASQAMTQIRSAIISTNEVLGSGVAKTMTLQNAFQAMYDKAGGDQNKLKELAGRIEAVNAYLALAGPNAQGATEDLMAMYDATGSVDRSLEHITSTTENQWSILGNRIKTSTKEIGEGVLTMSNMIASGLNEALYTGTALRDNYEAQRLELRKLEVELQRAVTGSEEFEAIKKQILSQYPDFIGEINTETASTQELLGVLDKVNKAYTQRYKFASRQKELNEAVEKQASSEEAALKARVDFEHYLLKLEQEAADNGVELKFDLNANTGDILNSVMEQMDAVEKEGLWDNMFPFYKAELQQMETYYNLENSHQNISKKNAEEVAAIKKEHARLNQLDLKTLAGQREAILKINAATKESDVTTFFGSGIPEIEKALKERMKVIDKYTAIRNAKTTESLAPYLESDLDEIKTFAEKRRRILNTDYQGTGSGGETDTTAFRDSLKEKEKQYKEYNAVVNQLGQETADKQYQNLLKEGEDYGAFLQNQLNKTRSFSEQREIALAAESAGVSLQRPKISSVSTLKMQGVVEFTIDDTSINYIRNRISQLTEEFNAANEANRPEIQQQLDYWNERLEAAHNGSQSEQEIYSNIRRGLEDLNNHQLRDYINHWKERLKEAEKGSKAEAEAVSNIQSAEKKIGENTAGTIREISSSLGEASDMFRKFGEEDLANTMDQLANVGKGVADLVSGIATGNPLAIVGASISILSSAITMDIESMTDKFVANIEKLEKAIADLDYAISRSTGMDRIENRTDKIEELKALEQQAQKAIQAEKEAEKQVKLLGLTVGKKGKGSGTDQAKLDELAADAEEARRAVQEVQDELNELFTGTTSSSITDSIVQGFKNGKFAVEDFADNFGDLMKNAMLQAFQLKYMEKEVAKFYEDFAAAGEDGKYTAKEIEALRALYAAMISGAQSDIDAINGILESTGVGSLGSDSAGSKKGMTGAVKSITEDTANQLGGYLNAIRLDMRQSLTMNEQSLNYLSEIASNTRYNRYLESIDSRMATIEKGMQEFGAQG